MDVDTVHLVFNFFSNNMPQFRQLRPVEIARVLKVDFQFPAHTPRVAVQDDHTVGQAHGFADRVRHEEHRLFGV